MSKTQLNRLLPFVFLGLVALQVSAATPSTPKSTVKAAVDAVMAILRNKSLDGATRRDSIRTVIDRHFDFVNMSQRVLAHNWRKANSTQQADFVAYFSDYLEAFYLKRIENYSGQEIEYVAEWTRGNKANVETFVVTQTNKIPVTYRLRHDPRSGQWLAYDVIIEGQSLVSSYRDIFGAIESVEGIEGVLSDVRRRAESTR